MHVQRMPDENDNSNYFSLDNVCKLVDEVVRLKTDNKKLRRQVKELNFKVQKAERHTVNKKSLPESTPEVSKVMANAV